MLIHILCVFIHSSEPQEPSRAALAGDRRTQAPRSPRTRLQRVRAHQFPRAGTARAVLAAIQADDIPRPSTTARSHALEVSAYLLADEVAARFDAACPAVATAVRARVARLNADEQ
jgi:hypothetical protein